MTNGQPSGTRNGSTIASTDSAATESIRAMVAESNAFYDSLRQQFSDSSNSVREGQVLIDPVQLMAVDGISYHRIAVESIAQVDAVGLVKGQVYEMFTSEQNSYARVVHNHMLDLLEGKQVTDAFVTKQPYQKRRKLVRIMSDLTTNADGKQGYYVHTGLLDPITPLSEPVWTEQDRAGGQFAEIFMYTKQMVTRDGTPTTVYTMYNKGVESVVRLGLSKHVSDTLARVIESDNWKLFQQVGATEPSLRRDSIRRSPGGQLVFWQAMRVCLDLPKIAELLTAPAQLDDPSSDESSAN